MRWLITGAGGMVGSDLRDELTARGEDVAALTRSDLDISDSRAVGAAIAGARPDIVVNCAAYTKVDDAEADENLANAINGSAVELLAHPTNEVNALLVHVSSDFVFDGSKQTPYEVNDRPRPISAYGRSKLLGEIAATHARRHLVVRTSWVFGPNGNNFVEAIRRQAGQGVDPLRVVDDQRGRPTYTVHLAQAIIRLALIALRSEEGHGIVHYADADECTWYDFARAIIVEIGSGTGVHPVSTDAFPRPASRPAYSVLSTERYERLTGVSPASWREGLRDYFERSRFHSSPQ